MIYKNLFLTLYYDLRLTIENKSKLKENGERTRMEESKSDEVDVDKEKKSSISSSSSSGNTTTSGETPSFVYVNKNELQRLEESIGVLQSQQSEQAKLIEHIQAQLNNCIRIQNKLKLLSMHASNSKRTMTDRRINAAKASAAAAAATTSHVANTGENLDENEDDDDVRRLQQQKTQNAMDADDDIDVYSVDDDDDEAVDEEAILAEENGDDENDVDEDDEDDDDEDELEMSNGKRRKLSASAYNKTDEISGKLDEAIRDGTYSILSY